MMHAATDDWPLVLVAVDGGVGLAERLRELVECGAGARARLLTAGSARHDVLTRGLQLRAEALPRLLYLLAPFRLEVALLGRNRLEIIPDGFEVFVTCSMLAVVMVRSARSSTRRWMSARASHTSFCAFSSSDSPQATSGPAAPSKAARTGIRHTRVGREKRMREA